MNLKKELKQIDVHFDSISTETLLAELKDCGLGVIRDCTESGWFMEGAKNTEPEERKE